MTSQWNSMTESSRWWRRTTKTPRATNFCSKSTAHRRRTKPNTSASSRTPKVKISNHWISSSTKPTICFGLCKISFWKLCLYKILNSYHISPILCIWIKEFGNSISSLKKCIYLPILFFDADCARTHSSQNSHIKKPPPPPIIQPTFIQFNRFIRLLFTSVINAIRYSTWVVRVWVRISLP